MKTNYSLISMQKGVGIEEKVVDILFKRGLTITTAESCTGGLLAGRIINVAGVSSVYERGFVTYSNEAKEQELGVKHKTLEEHGAVSKQTVKQMAKGAAEHAKADIAIAITGIAGPDGGTEEKPVGTVYIGIYYDGKVYWQECHFQGTRTEIRGLTVVNSLQFLLNVLE